MAKLAPLSATVSAFEYKLGIVEMKPEQIHSAVQVSPKVYCHVLADCLASKDHFHKTITIVKYQDIEGEQARAYRMKTIALRQKGNLTKLSRLKSTMRRP